MATVAISISLKKSMEQKNELLTERLTEENQIV